MRHNEEPVPRVWEARLPKPTRLVGALNKRRHHEETPKHRCNSRVASTRCNRRNARAATETQHRQKYLDKNSL